MNNPFRLSSVFTEDQLMSGTIKFCHLHEVEDRMDISRFDEGYKNDDETGLGLRS